MNYLKTRKMKLAIIVITLFALLQIYKFFKVRITSMDLPKGKIVFSSCLHGDSEIYTMNLNGSNLRRLSKYSIFGPTFDTWTTDFRPSFNFSGNKIVFDSNRDDKSPRRKITYYPGIHLRRESTLPTFYEIYIMDADSKNQTRLTFNQIGSYSPFLSLDGQKILFYSVPSMKDPFYEEIRIINTDGAGERILIRGDRIAGLARFSPDSQKVFFVFRGDLHSININKGYFTRLTYFNTKSIEQPDHVEGIPFVDNFVLSPDGKEIIIAAREKRAVQFIFYSMNTDGSGIKEIAQLDNPGKLLYISGIYSLTYSPDGQKIAFIADFGSDKIKFYILDRNGNFSLIRNLNIADSGIDNIENGRFIFTPDSKQVLFVASFPYGLFDDWFAWLNSVINEMYFNLKYYIFKRLSSVYDNKYLCIMDIETGNFKKITRLPFGSQFGHDFIYWQEDK